MDLFLASPLVLSLSLRDQGEVFHFGLLKHDTYVSWSVGSTLTLLSRGCKSHGWLFLVSKCTLHLRCLAKNCYGIKEENCHSPILLDAMRYMLGRLHPSLQHAW